jgi:hypothetical protein
MNPKSEQLGKGLLAPAGESADQQIVPSDPHARPIVPLDSPRINPSLTKLNAIERAAEVLRYSVLRAEYWLSPDGAMRQQIRVAVRVWLYVMAAALIAPGITAVIQHVTGWTAMSAEIVRNIAEIPLGLGKLLLACFAVVILFRLLFRR